MQEFPLSKLKIKIHGINNPTSVFKKKSFLSLNCIHKNKKSKTPLRIFSNDELPHYMLPIKCQINKTENNNNNSIKEPTKLRSKKSNIKITILSRNKSNNEIKLKQSKDINEHENSNIKSNVNNIYNTITFNKNNLNTNFFANSNLNDYSSSNKDNNENIISELNIINHNNNNNNNTSSFEEPSFQSLISELQKKINEQNILLSSRKKEIENLKKQLNDNNNKNKDLFININKNKEVNSFETNNETKNEINNLQKEIRNLKQEIESLNNKYQNEVKDKKEIEEKYKFIKNSVKNNSSREKDKNYYENKIIEQENKIIALEEELNNQKNKQFEISKMSHFELVIPKTENINKVNDLILNQKQYNDIKLILNVLLVLNNIDLKSLTELIGSKIEKGIEINSISTDICNILKISDKEKNIINNYIKDIILKSEKENIDLESELENLFKYKYNDYNNTNNINNNKINFVMNSENKKILYEKCKNFDYKNKHKVPFYYFKHLYKEICHKNKNSFSLQEFFNLLYECKKFNGNEINCFYDILYENLIENKKQNNEINNEYKLKYPDLVKNFLNKIIKEAFDKKREKFGNNQLNRARSFEKDIKEEDLISSNNINQNNDKKFNLDEGDE